MLEVWGREYDWDDDDDDDDGFEQDEDDEDKKAFGAYVEAMFCSDLK